MTNWNKNKWLTVLALLILLFLTYFRENFLLEINAVISKDEYNRAFSYWLSDFFQNKPINELNKWKWGVTLLFSFVMSLLTIASLYSWYQSKELLKLTGLIYTIVFCCLLLLALVGVLLGDFNIVYSSLRKVLGVIQSPIPFFVFFVLFYKIKANNNNG